MKDIYPVSDVLADAARVNDAEYQRMYKRSLEDSDAFWAEQARENLDWFREWDQVQDWNYDDVSIRWFTNGRLNACYNCLDRHLPAAGDRIALYWQGEADADQRRLTYRETHAEVCRMANVLKQHGITKGDRVCIYMPMIAEGVMAMLACARIGAVHSVVFGGFSSEALRDRIRDSQCRAVITATAGQRSGRLIDFKKNVDEAVDQCDCIETVFVVRHGESASPWHKERDVDMKEAMAAADADCEAVEMDAEDPLFILYTSGSTGKPKGVLHTTGGYLLYAALTHKYVFDWKPDDLYWCTADIGWITGHSYIVYGPLCNGASSLIYEGVPTYPDPGRFWQLVERYKINLFYTAPTVLRALMAHGTDPVRRHDRSSLRVLGTVGEPINPEAWEWYYDIVGDGRCPIADTWWQTETGGVMITPLPGATPLKPGSATRPFFGVAPALLDEKGKEISGAGSGALVIKRSWPGQMRTVYGDHPRFVSTYFSSFKGYYFSGDGARRDEDGYYWITGRMDDVINVSGHRMGTAEVESAIGRHPAVAESAVVGFPHDIKGQGIYAYVTLKQGQKGTKELREELVQVVRKVIGPIATPDVIQWAPGLPKTRSGKIMRRILRKIAADEHENLGDTSTLVEHKVVQDLVDEHRRLS